MKKIIAAFDGLKFSNSTKEYAIHLASLSNAHLVGVFLEDISYTSYKIYELVDTDGFSFKKQTHLDEKDDQTRKRSVKSFEAACQKAGINYTVHHDKQYAIDELLHESIYSDVLIIDSNETFIHYEEKAPARFIQHTLAKAHCPVMVVPDKYKDIEKIILLYDGTPSSVYAIKMFSYIFQALKNLPVEVVSVKTPNESLHLADNKLMKEFMKRHYPQNVEYILLKGDPSSEILSYLKGQDKNLLTILGAYSRSLVSRLIDESMADTLIKNVHVPLFIAHDK
jgi:nucleotide-binding universal stress UspA family protein